MISSTINTRVIADAMKKRGLTQTALASELGVSREAVSKWIRGESKPRPAKVLRIARLLELSFDEIYQDVAFESPAVAFRKKGSAKTTDEHVQRAQDMGLLLRNLVDYLPFDTLSYPAAFMKPSTDYEYVSHAARQIRKRMNLSAESVDFKNIIEFFAEVHAVLIPVMWGRKNQHENALHVFLPNSNTSWIYLNLDTKIMDFKFWMAHELAHVKTPTLDEADSELFADRFAAELLFPASIADRYLDELSNAPGPGAFVNKVRDIATGFVISPVTIFEQVNRAAELRGKQRFEVDIHPATANFNKQFKEVNEILFETASPSAHNYVRVCKDVFQTPIFDALEHFLIDSGKGTSFVQRALNIGVLDAKQLYRALIGNARKEDTA